MRNRVQSRRYGRDNAVVASAGATHVIKIGWKKKSGEKEYPDKLGGFVICIDSLDGGNNPQIDEQAMAALGLSPDQTRAGIAGGFKSDALPKQLRFVLMSDAAGDDVNGWAYPGTLSEAYECYGKQGLICYGDGQNASRKLPTGGRTQMECIPYGKDGADPDTYCQFSMRKECKTHWRLTLCLLVVGDGGQLRPLTPWLGMQARYRLDSSSEYGSMGALTELDAAATRLRGNINGITGSLTFQRKRRRTGEGAAIVGNILFQLDEEAIRAREEEHRRRDAERFGRMVEARTAGVPLELVPGDGPRLLAAPSVDVEPVSVTPTVEPESAALPDDDIPWGDPGDDAGAQPAEDVNSQVDTPTVAGASDDDLLRSLDLCAELWAADWAVPKGDALQRLTKGDVDGKPWAGAKSIASFSSTDPERHVKARALLRTVCARLEQDGNRNWHLEVTA